MTPFLKNALRVTGRASAAALDSFQRIVAFAVGVTAFLVVLHRLSGSYQPNLQEVSFLMIAAIAGFVSLGLYWWFIEDSARRRSAGAVVVQVVVAFGAAIGILLYWAL